MGGQGVPGPRRDRRGRPPRLLRYTHWSPLSGQPDVPENYHHLTFTLAESGGSTTVTLEQDGNGSAEEASHAEGLWGQVLGALRRRSPRMRTRRADVASRRCQPERSETDGSRRQDPQRAEEAKGKVKEAAGKVTDDEQLEAEGKADQAGADLKQAGEKVKDAFK